MPASIKYHKANIKSAIGRIRRGEHLTGLADGRVRVSLRSYLNHSRSGHDAGAGWRRRDATGAEAPPHLLGPCDLDCEPLYLSRGGMVDLLSLAQPTIVELLSFRFRSDLAYDFVSRFDASFPTRSQHRRVNRLQSALLRKSSRFLRYF